MPNKLQTLALAATLMIGSLAPRRFGGGWVDRRVDDSRKAPAQTLEVRVK